MENQDGQNHAIQQLVNEQKQQGVMSAYATTARHAGV